VGDQFGMQWEVFDATVKPRVMIMVSKIGHCLNDLLFRAKLAVCRWRSRDRLEPS
jgi:formyltetrahydrofolate deformylase